MLLVYSMWIDSICLDVLPFDSCLSNCMWFNLIRFDLMWSDSMWGGLFWFDVTGFGLIHAYWVQVSSGLVCVWFKCLWFYSIWLALTWFDLIRLTSCEHIYVSATCVCFQFLYRIPVFVEPSRTERWVSSSSCDIWSFIDMVSCGVRVSYSEDPSQTHQESNLFPLWIVSPAAFGAIRASGGSHLETSGVIWSHMESYGAIWSHLELLGAIWNYPEPLEPFGTIWNRLEYLDLSEGI